MARAVGEGRSPLQFTGILSSLLPGIAERQISNRFTNGS